MKCVFNVTNQLYSQTDDGVGFLENEVLFHSETRKNLDGATFA